MPTNATADRQVLHDFVDKLPPGQVAAALSYVQFLCADPTLLSLLTAPADDEPYTDSQRADDAEAAASIARGEGISHDEILRAFRK